MTFAENTYLDVSYFKDSTLKEPISNPDSCYLLPGDCVYASIPACDHPSSYWYRFDQFHLYACDDSGKKGEELFWADTTDALQSNPQNQGEIISIPVLCVPEDHEETEIIVIPVGKYEKHSIKLNDHFKDSSGNMQQSDSSGIPLGTWIVNEEEVPGNYVDVSPVEPLYIDYRYDDTKYCYVSSTPASFYHDDGLVRFETINANNNIEECSVELRSLEKNPFFFDPARFSPEHGNVTFEYHGQTVTEEMELPDGEVIFYKMDPEAGYHSSSDNGTITVNASAPDKTIAEIEEAVKFYPIKEVQVNLPQPVGGKITYTADGKILTGNKCKLLSGTVITMAFSHWNGWKQNTMDGEKYTVTAQEDQTVSIDGLDINTELFAESDDHKPTLKIALMESVQNASFDITASGISGGELPRYEDGDKTSHVSDFLGEDERLIFENKIGTDSGITLDVSDDTILNGFALKLDIAMEDTNKKEYNFIRYITDIPAKETFTLYDNNEIADSPTVYKDITITISKVEVVTYAPKTIDHADITVKLTDMTEPYILKKDDVLEASREAEITITPAKGYYITDPEASDDMYCDTMKYAKWEKDIDKILKKHPVKKYWTITLDSSDDYGICNYMLDGKNVSGTVTVYEGQKLTLEYELTDTDYEISRSGTKKIRGLFHKETESYTIPLSESLDGQTIKRADYITIQQKGE